MSAEPTQEGGQHPPQAPQPAQQPAGAAATWRQHPVDLRLSLPFLKWRFYLTVVGGAEQRASDRRARDRELYPVATAGNLLFTFGIVTCFAILALAALIAQSAILEI